MSKIFGIGLPKTGTVSLAKALESFDLRVIHNPFGFYKQVLEEANFTWQPDTWDALVHFGTRYYRHLDRVYPKSQFILTTRQRETWLDSCERWWEAHRVASDDPDTHLSNMSTFGTRRFHRGQFGDIFDQHEDCVRRCFRRAGKDKLLVLPLDAKDKLGDLTGFLGRDPRHGHSYPHENANP